jgi:hypothetical protein
MALRGFAPGGGVVSGEGNPLGDAEERQACCSTKR